MIPTDLELPNDRDVDNKVRSVARKIAFLMPHQVVLPDLKEVLIDELKSGIGDSEYARGAYMALSYLISDLESKGY